MAMEYETFSEKLNMISSSLSCNGALYEHEIALRTLICCGYFELVVLIRNGESFQY
jgi:hypothetical protein